MQVESLVSLFALFLQTLFLLSSQLIFNKSTSPVSGASICNDYLGTSQGFVSESFVSEYKDIYFFNVLASQFLSSRSSPTTAPWATTLLDIKWCTRGTTYISRLVVPYTEGIQIQLDKVKNSRAEIKSLHSQMTVEKKASVTEATGKAVVDMTEK
jgi:hypothetical protein